MTHFSTICQYVVACRSILSSRPDHRGPCQCRPLCKNSNTHSCYCWSGRRWCGWHSLLPLQRGTVCMLIRILRKSVHRLVLWLLLNTFALCTKCVYIHHDTQCSITVCIVLFKAYQVAFGLLAIVAHCSICICQKCVTLWQAHGQACGHPQGLMPLSFSSVLF